MTHVVTESCIRCRYTDCVDVCPVDCFREGPNFLTIDPDECIDCAVCVAECPVNAIYAEEDVPADQQQFIKLNVELARKWPSITKSKAPLADAEEWKERKEREDAENRKYIEDAEKNKPAKNKPTKDQLMKLTKQQLLTFDNTLKMYMKKDDMINRILN